MVCDASYTERFLAALRRQYKRVKKVFRRRPVVKKKTRPKKRAARKLHAGGNVLAFPAHPRHHRRRR
jgi:hypothetical protein